MIVKQITMESKTRILFDLVTKKRFFILGYHSIIDDPADPWSISPDEFSAQMTIIAKKKIRVLSLDYCINQLQQGIVPGNSVVITFDDGYRNFLQNAVPILQKHNFHATLFVPVNNIGKISSWSKPESKRNLLEWSDLKDIAQLGYSIGSHGLNHVDLTSLETIDMSEEIIDSKKILEDRLGNPVYSFACPYSKCSEREAIEIERAGYLCSCGPGKKYGNGLMTDKFMLGRSFIHKHDSHQDFINQINGYSFIIRKFSK